MRLCLSRLFPALALWVLVLAAPAHAAGLSVSPGILDLDIAPGSSASSAITISNLGRRGTEISAFVFDVWYEDGQLRTGAPASRARSAADWVTLTPPALDVPPLRSRPLNVTVAVPEDASGAYTQVLYIETAPNGRMPTAMASARIGVMMYINVSGTGEAGLTLRAFTASGGDATTPLALTVDVMNTGTLHLRPRLQGVLRDEEARVLGRLTEGNPPHIPPGRTAPLQLDWEGELAPGRYQFVGNILVSATKVIPVIEWFNVGGESEQESHEPVTPAEESAP